MFSTFQNKNENKIEKMRFHLIFTERHGESGAASKINERLTLFLMSYI